MEKLYLSLFNNYPNYFFIALLSLLSFFAYSSKEFQLDASSDTLIIEQDEDLKKYRKVIEDYGTSDFLIVTFTDKKRILTELNLEIIKSFVDKLKQADLLKISASLMIGSTGEKVVRAGFVAGRDAASSDMEPDLHVGRGLCQFVVAVHTTSHTTISHHAVRDANLWAPVGGSRN